MGLYHFILCRSCRAFPAFLASIFYAPYMLLSTSLVHTTHAPYCRTQAAREAGKPVVRPLWVSMCWQQFLDSKGVLVEVSCVRP
jgi:hypothetical protein